MGDLHKGLLQPLRVRRAAYDPPMVYAPPRAPQADITAVSAEATAGSDAHVQPLDHALQVIGDRWSLAIIARLVEGPQRFSDLATAVAPIARTVLSDRLRKLEDAGLVHRRQYSQSSSRCNYRLSLSGADLARVCAVLADWSSRHLGDGSPVLRHVDCGHSVVPAYACESCGPVSPRVVTAG